MNALDASVSVKWFKRGEEYEDQALQILTGIKSFEIICTANEWMTLEIIRALVNANYPREEIDKAYDNLIELMETGAIKRVNVSDVLSLSKAIECNLNLYAADAVHLATAINTNSRILWTEDKHLHKTRVKDFAGEYGLQLRRLSELDY